MTTPPHIDFIGIGSGKCGSTWLFENMIQHPDICDSNPKELNYFSDLYESQPSGWYQSQFSSCPDNKLKGEFSVTYMYREASVGRIHKDHPDAKLFAIVRNPADRTYSDFLHYIRKGDISTDTSFEEFIADEKNLEFAKYYDYLTSYFDMFPRNQIKIIILEELLNDIEAGFHSIYTFLGVSQTDFIPPEVSKKRNQATNYRFLWLEQILVRTYRFMARRGYTKILEQLKRTGLPLLLRKINSDKKPVEAMNTSCRNKLNEYYRPSNKQLSELIQHDISIWDN